MKKTLMLAVAAAGIGFAAFATDYEWTGNAGDGKWTTVGNWRLYSGGAAASDYPRTTDDLARFTSSVTVSVDTGAELVVGLIAVHANAGTVMLNGTTGSYLNLNKAASVNGSSFMVLDGSKLVVNIPVTTEARIDKWQSGEIEFTADVKTTTASNPLVLDNGKITLSGTAAFSAENGDVGIGNYTNGDTATLELKDSASLTAKRIRAGINATSTAAVGHIIQDGEGTAVNVSGNLLLADAAGHAKPSIYELNAGTLTVGGALTVGSAGLANYVQRGGTSTVASVALKNGSSVSLRGGVLKCPATPSVENGCVFELDGGTFELSGGTYTWNAAIGNFQVKSESALKTVGAASLTMEGECSTYGLNLAIGEDTTVTVASNARVSAPVGSTNAWKVTIADGATLKLNESTARLAVPLDLAVRGTGKIQLYSSYSSFNYGFRGIVVAHSLSVDGVVQAKGRYNGTSNSFLNAGTADSVNNASMIVVPYTWIGAGADNDWNTGANWEGGIVPPSGSPVDISRASSITLNSDVDVSCLVAMPNDISRKTTVTGTGSISVGHAMAYSCGIYIPVGCELVLDVDFKRSSNNVLIMMGGGRLTTKKTLPSNQNSTTASPLLAIDGTIALAGKIDLIQYPGTQYNFFNHYSANLNTKCELLIEDGTEIASVRLSEGYPSFLHDVYVRQTGGVTTWTNCWIHNVHMSNPDGAVCYYLDGGEMNAPNGVLLGNDSQVSAGTSRPGGSFEMSGGTLKCGGIKGGCNQNYARLYGGDIYLSGDCSNDRIPDEKIHKRVENAVTFYLGGVTFHPVGTYRTFAANSTICLTGKNGDPVFDMTDYVMAITGGTIEGPGGFVFSGPNGRTGTIKGTYTNTGTIRLTGGANLDVQTATLNGPTKLVVDHPQSVMNIYSASGTTACNILKAPDTIMLAAASCLSFGNGQAITVKRLIVGGTDYAAGTYTFGNGTVTVAARSASWLDGTVGDLSYMVDGTTTAVDSATTLSSLTYNPAMADETNTLAGAALTFANGANIHVERGATLVIGNNVVLGGKITKTGWGEVVFNGAVTNAVTPAADDDNYWLTVIEGGATFDGAVEGVRIVTCGAIDANEPPVVTLKENCRVQNYGIILTAWNEANVACRGETHQKGAIVDYSTTIFDDLINNRSNWALTQPRVGGYGRYVLDSGELRGHNNFYLSFVMASNGSLGGTFEFVQNGGTFIQPQNFYFARVTSGVKFTYTLNDGRFEFGGHMKYGGYANPLLNILNLNGGTYVANDSDTIKREIFTLNTCGTVTIEVAEGKTLTIADDSRTATSFVKTGAGSLALDGTLALNGLDVQAGSVTLTDKMQSVASSDATLSLARGVTLALDYDGQMPFKTLTIGSRGRGAGVYSATQGPAIVKSILDGDGELLILEGTEPGTIISLR